MQPQSCPNRLCGALLDIVGSGVVGVPDFGCPAQPREARPSRRGARFSLGNFVVDVRPRGGRRGGAVALWARLWFIGIGHVRRGITMVFVRPLRIVHGEAAYHFDQAPTASSAAVWTPATCGNARARRAGRCRVEMAWRRRLFGFGDLLQPGEFSFRVWQSYWVRFVVSVAAALVGAGVLAAPPSSAGPTVCDYPACTPGIMPHQVLGAPCDNTTYYAFGVADGYVSFASQPGRLMFCGSPRRYQPRWFRSPPMAGVKEENANCQNYQNYVAQAPDGLFLVCFAHDGVLTWVRGDT